MERGSDKLGVFSDLNHTGLNHGSGNTALDIRCCNLCSCFPGQTPPHDLSNQQKDAFKSKKTACGFETQIACNHRKRRRFINMVGNSEKSMLHKMHTSYVRNTNHLWCVTFNPAAYCTHDEHLIHFRQRTMGVKSLQASGTEGWERVVIAFAASLLCQINPFVTFLDAGFKG